ncbi:ABC transporter permease [Arsenicicoccus bolidensis]|uniref:ABC transporter permease n=1 Tax=Arsenicicoccus bolidensis TaxID=229480 RepID=UPI000419B6B3|nr:ABC transporter permease [Arsenicicoccus bolidensis]
MSTGQAAAPAPTKTTTRTSRSGGRLRQVLGGAGGPFLGLVVLAVALFIATPAFLTVNNLLNILDQITILGVLALGMTFVIVTGGIDLSVGAVLAFSMMVLGWTSHDAGWPLPLSILAAILAGGLCGLVSGLGITRAKLPPFIATLAMLSIARGAANVITDGQQIVGFPDWFTGLSTTRYFGFLTVTAVILVLLLVAGWAFMRYRPGGRGLYAIGGSPEVARLAGIDVKRATTGVYVTMGLLAGLAGVILATRLDSAQPSAANGIELDTIAAVVIGGASLSGGVGRITGTIVGVLIIGVLRNGLNLMSVSPFVQMIVIGVVIALAVMVDVLRRRDQV